MTHSVGGHPALDFLNTKPDVDRIDSIGTASQFFDWLDASGLGGQWVNPADAQVGRLAEADWPALMECAHGLRDWLRRQLERPGEDCAPLNDVLALAVSEECVGYGGDGRVQWLRRDRWVNWSSTLLPLVRSVSMLLTEEDVARVRRCQGQGCRLVFLDVSRAGSRRWCSMSECGTRDKVAAFRARKRA